LGAIIYLKDIEIRGVHSHSFSGLGRGANPNLREGNIIINVSCIGKAGEIEDFLEFAKGKMITILKSYSMDWHVKSDHDRIEFIIGVMGQILEFQTKGKLNEAKALLKLVETVLPEYRDEEQYQLAEDMRNMVWDQIYSEKKK